ncbi:hypothetical protein OUZ56_021578 [Daphnia magna]|uniref:Ricin B lectin domain-containing protein n=1 Tax=Daphnia magna TaxID=35525 RepID=A0ABR0ATX6_9CRUS|nr:hypothetical protein OUZ56_021578 [Daphnia magna]
MEDCDTDWTKCQDELKTFIKSNDPLVQSQVSVGNCSKVTNKGQAFEYTSDFTIRPFNTNACIKANTTMLILQECANTSSIWGTFEHTGQLMATDRTGLHSPASDRKCLTLKDIATVQVENHILASNIETRTKYGRFQQQPLERFTLNNHWTEHNSHLYHLFSKEKVKQTTKT